MGKRLDLRAGARLDRYELMFPIAEGGMAAVWLARLRGKRGFEQLVAIKVIKPHLSEDMRFEEMFLDEARIASRIRHPNVAGILDLGEEEGILYLVMEWVDGDSLSRTRRLVAKHGVPKIPLRIALRIMADVAAGLHAAHEQKDEAGANLGVIHRDVSPQNILVSTSGAVKVIDFGIAKARNRAAAETTDGLVKGKVAYMSPEQAEGLPIDRRSDVWAVGVCLYELVTGKLPFDGDSQQEILRLLVRGTDVPTLPNDIPTVVRGVIEQALARDPKNRFLTAAALERALEGALTTLDLPTTSDDIATFLNTTCPERLRARREMLAEVEKVTESLEGEGGGNEQETKDVTPTSAGTATSTNNTTQPLQQTALATAAKSDSVDVRFSDAGKAPPIVENQVTEVTHSAERSPSTTTVSSKSRALPLAIVALLGLGGVGVFWRLVQSPKSLTTTTTASTPPLPSTTLIAAPPPAMSSSPLADPPSASLSIIASQKSPPSTTPPPTRTFVKSPPPRPVPSTTTTTASPGFDSDGIPLGPKK